VLRHDHSGVFKSILTIGFADREGTNMPIAAALPWLLGAGGAALPWLMRNPRVAQAIGGKLGKKVFTPPSTISGPLRAGEKFGGRGFQGRDIPAGGFVGRHPIISSAGLGYGGTIAGSMLAGSPDEPTASPRGDVPLTVPGGVPGGPPVDEFTSNLPSYA